MKGLCSNNIPESLHTLAMLGSQNLHQQLHSLILEYLDTSDILYRERLNHLVQLIQIRFYFDTNVFSDKRKEQKLNIPFNLQISSFIIYYLNPLIEILLKSASLAERMNLNTTRFSETIDAIITTLQQNRLAMLTDIKPMLDAQYFGSILDSQNAQNSIIEYINEYNDVLKVFLLRLDYLITR